MKALLLAGVSACVFLSTLDAHAGFVRPDSASASSEYFDGNYGPQFTIDGSGLPANFDETDTHTGYSEATWINDFGSGPVGQWIEWHFDDEHDLSQIHLWNNAERSTASFDLHFYDAARNELAAITGLSMDDDDDPVAADTFTFGGTVQNVRSVRATIASSHDSTYAGFGEVAFDGVISVDPTPVANLFQPDFIESVSSEYSSAYTAQMTIDGSGLPDDFNEFSLHTGYSDTTWIPSAALRESGAIDWGFDSPVEMAEVYLWNNGTRPTGTLEMILFDENWSQIADYTINLPDTNDSDVYAEKFEFDQLHTGVKYVRGNFTNPYNRYVGLGEIAFSDGVVNSDPPGPPGIPTPAAAAIMLSGLALLARRRG